MSTDTVGGVFTYTADLITELARHGAEVAVVTFGRIPTVEQRRRLAGAGAARVIETDLALEWMDDPWADLAAGERRLLDLERELAPDVIHLNAYAHGGAPFHAPAVVVGHSCVFSWWRAVHGCAPPPDWDRYRRVVRRGLAGATALVAPSQTMLDELTRCYGPLRPPARVILNGTALAPEAPLGGREAIVVGSGRLWDEAKNAAALERVARRRALRGRILLAGDDDPARPAHAEPQAGETGARRLGTLTPAELTRLRRRAMVYAAPARYEPFGLGILEAARDGCALVLGDIPSLRELWQEAATFVDPGDEDALADALQGLLASPDAAIEWGARARERSRRYAASAMGDAYLDLYRRLGHASRAVAA